MAMRGIKAAIDLAELEKLCAMQPTDEEVASFFGVSVRTILRRKKSTKFSEAMERGRARGRLSLRRAQLKLVENGSAAMAIFLGKNYLHQSDQLNVSSADGASAYILMPMPERPISAKQLADDAVTIEVGGSADNASIGFQRLLASCESTEPGPVAIQVEDQSTWRTR